MFEKLQIRGFQKHKNLTIEFAEGVTTIVGPSDKGKSAILRALECLITNEPSGTSYLNWETESAAMRLFFEGGVIKKVRNTQKHVYEFNGEIYKSFGTKVPEPIVRALNVSSLSFQNQFDAPFWFSCTAGEVSRQLNKIVNLDLIDISLTKIATLLKTANLTKEIIEKRLKDIATELDSLSFVDEINTDLDKVEALEVQTNEILTRGALLTSLVARIDQAKRRIETQRTIHQDGMTVIELGKTARKITRRHESLQTLLTTIQTHQATIAKRPPSIEPISVLMNEMVSTKNKRIKLSNLIKTGKEIKLLIKEANQSKIENQKIFETQIGKVCPLCGKPQ